MVVTSDIKSVSNEQFSAVVVMTTAAWLQDAPLILQKYPHIRNEPPYTLLQDPAISESWVAVRDRVLKAAENATLVNRDQQVERHTIIQHIAAANEKTRGELAKWCDNLPKLVADAAITRIATALTKPPPPTQAPQLSALSSQLAPLLQTSISPHLPPPLCRRSGGGGYCLLRSSRRPPSYRAPPIPLGRRPKPLWCAVRCE